MSSTIITASGNNDDMMNFLYLVDVKKRRVECEEFVAAEVGSLLKINRRRLK
jgi:hypothetical protein